VWVLKVNDSEERNMKSQKVILARKRKSSQLLDLKIGNCKLNKIEKAF
jgi:hypothetical protein